MKLAVIPARNAEQSLVLRAKPRLDRVIKFLKAIGPKRLVVEHVGGLFFKSGSGAFPLLWRRRRSHSFASRRFASTRRLGHAGKWHGTVSARSCGACLSSNVANEALSGILYFFFPWQSNARKGDFRWSSSTMWLKRETEQEIEK